MIAPSHDLPIKRQAQLLGISRGSVYYLPKPISPADLALMRRLDELHLQHPFMGVRMLRDQLKREGIEAGRKRIATAMRRLGIVALYRKPGTSKMHPGHTIYPYLLRDRKIARANEVWALDTSYIPLARGFVYLTAVIDWASRKVLAAKVAITLEACHGVDVLQEALARHGRPEIVNTDQGSQFTAQCFADTVLAAGCKLSMDGRGAWRDNVIVERLWKSVKYEEVYLHAYDSVRQAKESIMHYLGWYNRERPHSGVDRQTPDEAYENMLAPLERAA
jgi:putative transposase